MTRTRYSIITRITAILLSAALVTPMLGLSEFAVVRAAGADAPSAEPPIPFAVRTPGLFTDPIFGESLPFMSSLYALLAPAPVPSGLEQPVSRPVEADPNAMSPPPPPQPAASVDFDFDGDGKADVGRRHPSNSEWKIKNSNGGSYTTTTLGSSSATIAPGDFDGDDKTDMAVFSAGTWTIRKSSNGQTETVSFGASGDRPVVGDYDGDDVSDCAVFRPSTNTWWIKQSTNGQTVSSAFGAAGDVTAQGDFDGDGKTDVAVFRPSSGDWHVSGSTAGYFTFHWGIASDVPVPADYDNDGKTDFAVYRGTTGVWYAAKSSDGNNSYLTQYWGNYGDQPVPADYDGDGKADFAVWRPTNGTWYIVNSGTANSYTYENLGVAGDTAVSSAYVKQIGGYIYSYDFAKVRLSPKNSTGGTDLYSRNFAWGAPLVGLAGRAGLDAGFGISYNSLVWTKDPATNTVVFNADNSNLTPGFRFGFPTIEPVYYDASTSKFAYMMVTPSGGRVEFRQTTNSNMYETADSSYAELKINGTGGPNDPADQLTITVTGTDGTRADYEWKNGAYRCQKITDRNGNYITVNHDANGLLQTVTDTLGRVVTVNYNSEALPISVTQTWKTNNGTGSDFTRTYATLSYTTKEINTNFTGLSVIGPGNGYQLKVLDKVTFPTETNGTGPSTAFSYNSYGQVTKITNKAADGHTLNYASVNLPADATAQQTDCPRFTESRGWTENFNLNSSGVEQETVVSNSLTENATYDVNGHSGTATKIEVSMSNHPHGAVSKTFVGSSGWMEGLTIATEDWANGTNGSERKRWTWNGWTQDDTNASYILNPRVTDSEVGDTGNVKKSKSYYLPVSENSPVALFGLVWKSEILDQNNAVLKRAETDYNLASAYTDRRIIGLPSEVRTYGIENNSLTLATRTGYTYDQGDFSDTSLEQNIANVIMHDTANYGASFTVGRGNLTTATRYDVTGATSSVSSQIKYNIAGAPVAQIDPLGRTAKISYADRFNDTSTSRYTYALPTRVYDPAGNYSEVKYRFDTGANVWAKSPAPAGNTTGKETTREFDAVGRLLQETVVNSGAYTRYEYPSNNIQSKVFTTIVNLGSSSIGAEDEVMTEAWTDGAGRVRRSRTEHPGSTGGWSATLAEYDILGQVKRSTVPTEVNSSYEPAGDDATRGWLWTETEFDWKGRTTRTIPTDSNGSDGKDQLISYEGCGCAGGQVTTVQSEVVPKDTNPNETARRTQKVYEDILGRTWKTEVLDWTGAVYSTTVQTFNGRDQITKTRQYAGGTSSTSYQDVNVTFDGHGRMATRHYPIEDASEETKWIYNADDSVQQTIDPRGAIKNFTYNDPRGLLTQISYQAPGNQNQNLPIVTAAPTVTFSYDAAGNRTGIDTADVNEVTYTFDEQSRIIAETVDFDALSNNLTIGYSYNLSGGLRSVTDPFGYDVNYAVDKTARVTGVTGDPTADNTTGNYAGNIQYRAFGQIKQMDYLLPTETPEIKLGYDNRLRVNHTEVTKPNGFLMKADFAYGKDSKVESKNDLLDDKWDRTMKYDFAGRLTFNQFGLGVGTNNQNKRVYEQSIQYDGFSMMNSRQTNHWENDSGFTETYVNGRINPFSGNFDAAGNIIRQGDIQSDPHTYVDTTYDASGRRTRMFDKRKGRFGNVLNMIQEHLSEYVFDGDGRPVIEREGFQTYHVNDSPPSSPLTAAPKMYQVWSTVLGSSLTSVKPDGSKWETKIFAGGALIAKEGATGPHWLTSDPVTGSTATWRKIDTDWLTSVEETEPLGQRIYNADPDPIPDPTYDTTIRNADYPQWQCAVSDNDKDWGSFDGLPFHCQMQILKDLSRSLDSIYGFWNPNNETSPAHVGESDTSPPAPPPGSSAHEAGHQMAFNRAMNYTLAASRKPTKHTGEPGGESACPEGTTWIKDANGEIQCVGTGVSKVDVDPPSFDGNILDYLAKQAPLMKLILERVEMVGFTETQSEMILKHVAISVLSKPCVDAFKAAGIPTPAEVIRDRGLLFINAEALLPPLNSTLKKLGFSDDERSALRSYAERKMLSGAGGFTIDPNLGNGLGKPVFTVLFNSSFVDQTDFHFVEIMPHEAIHRSNVGTHQWPYFWSHDLAGYDHYANIVKNCSEI